MSRNRGLTFLFAICCITSTATAQPLPEIIRSVRFENCSNCWALVQASDTTAFNKWIETRPVTSIKKLGPRLFKISAPASVLNNLKNVAGVQYVDKGNRQPRPETILGRFDITANSVASSKAFYPDINGERTMVSIKEKPFFKDDIDLRGRVNLDEQLDSTETLHASIMATIAAGAGNSSSHAEGVAPAALVTSSDYDNLLPDDGNSLLQQGVTVQNHSYGVGMENYYGIESKEYDAFVFEYPTILHVFSSGNEGDQTPTDGRYQGLQGVANLTGQFKTAKNVLTVGSVNRMNNIVPQASKGPAYDGRIKPELVAYGDAGSSESAAVASGAALLVQQAYYDLNGQWPDASLVKAVLINSADDVGRPGIDFESGYGNINVKKAVATVKERHIVSADIGNTASDQWPITIPPGVDVFKVTLLWPDPPAEPFNEHALLNNLDIELHSPNGDIVYPWILNSNPSLEELQSAAIRGRDTINNVELVSLKVPEPGAYTIVIKSSELVTQSQNYYLAMHYGTGFEWHHPVLSSFLIPNELNVLRWSTDSELSGALQYRMVGAENWIQISEVDLSQREFGWTAPNLSGNVQFKVVAGTQEFVSDYAPLSRNLNPSVDFNCNDEVMISWPRDEGASAYVIYQLGEKYLEALTTIADTFAILNKSNLTSQFLSVVSKYDDRNGSHESIVKYSSQGVGCYFITVLPQVDIESAKATIDVHLGTTFQLLSAQLEWKHGTVWEVVETLDPVPGEMFSMIHQDPLFDQNIYRVKLTTIDGRLILSEEVSILIAGENSLYAYPNPVEGGEEINVIVNNEDAMLLYLFDSCGRLARKTGDFGTIKQMSTTELSSGIYFLKAVKPNGQILTSKIMVR
jgi:hypothetical protein